MDVTLVIMILLQQGLWETEAFVITKEEGEKAEIKCSHSNAMGNVKYFCTKSCTNGDILITSTQKEKERYKLEDKGNTFLVTISDLRKADQGTYWCGVERFGVDTYIEVVIQVLKNEEDNRRSSTSSLSFKKLVYIGSGLGVVVLALAVVLLVFMRHRKKSIRESKAGKDHETVYAIPLSKKKDGQHDTVVSSGNVCKESSCEPQIQEDGLHYSSVIFVKPTDTNPSFQHVQADESTVYSSVQPLQ